MNLDALPFILAGLRSSQLSGEQNARGAKDESLENTEKFAALLSDMESPTSSTSSYFKRAESDDPEAELGGDTQQDSKNVECASSLITDPLVSVLAVQWTTQAGSLPAPASSAADGSQISEKEDGDVVSVSVTPDPNRASGRAIVPDQKLEGASLSSTNAGSQPQSTASIIAFSAFTPQDSAVESSSSNSSAHSAVLAGSASTPFTTQNLEGELKASLRSLRIISEEPSRHSQSQNKASDDREANVVTAVAESVGVAESQSVESKQGTSITSALAWGVSAADSVEQTNDRVATPLREPIIARDHPTRKPSSAALSSVSRPVLSMAVRHRPTDESGTNSITRASESARSAKAEISDSDGAEAPIGIVDMLASEPQAPSAFAILLAPQAKSLTKAAASMASSVESTTLPQEIAAPKRLTIELEPASLGAVVVQMKLSHARVDLLISVTSTEALHQLDSTRDKLVEAMQAAGAAVDCCTIQMAATPPINGAADNGAQPAPAYGATDERDMRQEGGGDGRSGSDRRGATDGTRVGGSPDDSSRPAFDPRSGIYL